jgi:hypothetical protein
MSNFEHTRMLAQFLKMESMGAVELKRTVEKNIPRELSYHDFDGKTVNARELLLSEGIEGSTLIPTEILATVIEGSEPARCFRDVLPVYQMKGMSMSVPVGATGTYAPIVSEGSEIPIETQDYTSVTFTAVKYAVRPVITNEMIDDGLFDVIATEVRKAGMRMENTLNRVCLAEMIDNDDNVADCGGSGATPLLYLATAQQNILADGFMPGQIIFSPAAYAACQAEGLVLSTQFANDMLRTGTLGTILGMPTRMCSIASTTTVGAPGKSTATWGFASNDQVGALMLDTSVCGAIGMRQDIKVEQYADSIRQMQGVSLSMRMDCQALQNNGIGSIIY